MTAAAKFLTLTSGIPTLVESQVDSSSAASGDVVGLNSSNFVDTSIGGTGVDASLAADGALLIGNSAGLSLATLTAGSNVTITNGSGTITIAAASASNPTATILASASIAAGDLVNVYNNSGTANVRPADNTSSSTFANGVALSAISSAASGVITFGAVTVTGLSGLTPGTLFLSTSGGVTSTAPSSAGDVIQNCGLAITATTAVFNPGQNYNIA